MDSFLDNILENDIAAAIEAGLTPPVAAQVEKTGEHPFAPAKTGGDCAPPLQERTYDSAQSGTVADAVHQALAQSLVGKHIWCYDGVCGICNASVQFFLKRDRRGLIRFTHLQGEFAQRELRARGVPAAELDAGLADSVNFRTFYLIANYGTPQERVYHRSRGTRYALVTLGGGWALLGHIGWWLPDVLFDWSYNLFSRFRYRLGKRHDACVLPDAALKARFIEE